MSMNNMADRLKIAGPTVDKVVKSRIFRFVRVSGRDFGGGQIARTRRKLLKQLAIFNAFPKIASSPQTLNGAQN